MSACQTCGKGEGFYQHAPFDENHHDFSPTVLTYSEEMAAQRLMVFCAEYEKLRHSGDEIHEIFYGGGNVARLSVSDILVIVAALRHKTKALEEIELLATNHGGWLETDARKLVSDIHGIASASIKIAETEI